MKFWNRKNKIEFFNNEASIIENFPIIESKDLKLNWVKKARQDFQDNIKPHADNIPGFTHLTRCPGIFDLFKYGYIISLHKDIIIKSKGKSFKVGINKGVNNSVSSDFFLSPQESSSESDINLVPTPPWAADFIMKINTGWYVIAPKGVKFLMLPIAYPDTFSFTTAIGILDPEIATQLNFQLFWNEKDEEEIVIPAGTPLGHLIPLSEKKYQMVQRNTNQRDHMWIVKLASATSATFSKTAMRTKITNMYNQYWKR